MDFEHSMRNFYTNPNTEIPNSQNDFINWCYGNMPSRKEGTDLEQKLNLYICNLNKIYFKYIYICKVLSNHSAFFNNG